MSTAAKPRWPAPIVFEGKNLVDAYEVDCMIAQLLGWPRPKRPQKPELLNADEVAGRLKCARSTVTLRLRQSRKQALASAEAPNQDQAA
jgi:hypothetical protein